MLLLTEGQRAAVLVNAAVGDMLCSNQAISALGRLARHWAAGASLRYSDALDEESQDGSKRGSGARGGRVLDR